MVFYVNKFPEMFISHVTLIIACRLLKSKILVEKTQSHSWRQLTKFFIPPGNESSDTIKYFTPTLTREFSVINRRTIFKIN